MTGDLGYCAACLVNGFQERAVLLFLGTSLCQPCGAAAWNAYLAGGAPTPQAAANTAAKLPPHPRA